MDLFFYMLVLINRGAGQYRPPNTMVLVTKTSCLILGNFDIGVLGVAFLVQGFKEFGRFAVSSLGPRVQDV